jgi:hypothetical protein
MFSYLVLPFLISANEPPKNLLQREKIEVRVGSDIIATTDVEIMIEALAPSMQDQPQSAIRSRAIEALVDQKLMGIYLQQFGFSVDSEVERRMNTLSANPEFKKMLEVRKMTTDKFRAQLKLQIERAQFENAMRRSLLQTTEEKDLKAYYKNNPEQFKKSFEAELSECLIGYGSDPKAALSKAEFFVNHPTKFSDCVKDLSQGSTASKGGRIGTFSWGVLPEEIEARIIHLKAGEVAMNKRPDGIQLLKVNKMKNLGPVTFEVAQERIRERLESEKLKQEFEKTLSNLRANTFIKIES